MIMVINYSSHILCAILMRHDIALFSVLDLQLMQFDMRNERAAGAHTVIIDDGLPDTSETAPQIHT